VKWLTADGTTFRETVRVSTGGHELRVIMTNEFGEQDLTIEATQIAMPAPDGSIVAGSSQAVTFNGKPGVVIPAGSNMVSDPIHFKLAPLSDVDVSFFVPMQKLTTGTYHGSSRETGYFLPGNHVTDTTLTTPKKNLSWYFFKGIDVASEPNAISVVTLGDSITDGAHSSVDKNARWPNVLAERLQANAATKHVSVLDEGIGGNRVLHDKTGPSALARLDRDVLAQRGVKYVIVMEAINDIGHAYSNLKTYDVVTADDLITGYMQIITRCHAHGIKVYGATLTPYVGSGYSSDKGEAVRQAVNEWIRTSGKFDGVIDFDKATRDPKDPGQFKPGFNGEDGKFDHLHPNDAGYKAMGDSIDLSLFTK
ncbi:MAG: SGNH/GDSL hydrolase family protein, partial [Bryocella sp.]